MTELHAEAPVRAALEEWLRQHGSLSRAAAAVPGAEARRGRGRVLVVTAPVGGGRWVVRHYRRGGAVASVLGDRYLRVGRPRPEREYRIGRLLADRGIPVPEHLGAAVYPSGIWYRGDLVTRYVEGSRDLAAVVFGLEQLPGGGEAAAGDLDGMAIGGRALTGEATGPRSGPAGADQSSPFEARAALHAAGALVRRLHDAGVVHPDLNLKNVLLTGPADAPRALILDLDRAELGAAVAGRERERMLRRFWRSAAKWERRTGQRLGAELRDAFVAGYERPSV